MKAPRLALELRLLTGLALASGVAFLTTPLAIRAAGRFDFYDKPLGYKGHATATPYLGGSAVVLAFALAIGILAGDWTRTGPLLGGMLVLCVVGTVDDRRNVSPLVRVLIEAALATLIFALGHGWDLGSGPISLALTVIWVVGVVNAVNLFDNMDGAASTMAAVICAAVAVLGFVVGDRWLAVAAIALSGACVGFLPHNLASPGARIFLGDGGSMPVGFAVAALVMVGASAAAPAWQALLIGLLLVGVLAIDTCLVVFSRTRRGISILTGGQDHLTHRTRRWLRTARPVAMALGSLQALISALALVAIEGGSRALVGATVLYLAGLGALVALLESRTASEALTATPAPEAGPQPRSTRLRAAVPTRRVLLFVLGFALGLGPFSGGYYDSGEWVPAGVVLVVGLVAILIARPPRLTLGGVLALTGLAGLAGWTLLSALWAESVEQAIVEGNRYVVYAALLGLLLALLRSRADALWLLGSLSAAGVVVAATVVVWLLGDAPSELFRGGRLNEPLGYINGQATFFLIALFPCLALAEQRRSPPAAGLGMGVSLVLVSLILLSQSRGAALALLLTLLLLLAVLPGRVRRAWAVVIAGGAVAVTAASLLDVAGLAQAGQLTPSVMRTTVVEALGAALVAGVLWGMLSAGVNALGRPDAARLRTAAAVTLLVGVLALGLAGASQAGRVGDSARYQYRAFTHSEQSGTSATGDSTRLISGAGNRYDYWRVATAVWREHPVLGNGGGNFDAPYFARRATTEDIRQPHSVELQTLSETGLIGGAWLLVILAGLAVGARRSAVAAGRSAGDRLLAVAALGSFSAWLVHTSVDWIHLLPGVTGMALAALAALVTTGSEAGRARPRAALTIILALLMGVAGLSLTRQGVAEHFRRTAERSLAERPAKALVEANRSLRLDSHAVGTYYVKASAFARYGEAEAAQRTLRQAAGREPSDFVTWSLLGDLAVRRGRIEEARRHYRRALALNPLNASLRRSAADPAAALR